MEPFLKTKRKGLFILWGLAARQAGKTYQGEQGSQRGDRDSA